jgi:hypothetical protein
MGFGFGEVWRRLGLWWAQLSGSGVRFGLLRLILLGSGAAFGFRVLMLFGSGQNWRVARQAAAQTPQQRPNKAMHPTAYSFVRSSLRFRRRVSLIVVLLRLPNRGRVWSTPVADRPLREI